LINFLSELNVFYDNYFEVFKLLGNNFPCIWKNGSIAINVRGDYRFCINDWATKIKRDNIESLTLLDVYKKLKEEDAEEICNLCNQNPYSMSTGFAGKLYSFI